VFRSYVKSYKQLPLNLYHQQWKFRDEVRPRFGVMRGREFLMKDAYSFDLTEEDARVSYRKMFCAYLNAFDRMGLTAIPMRADTGPIGGDMSHEFIILADTGESAVFCDKALLDLPAPGLDLDFDADLNAQVEKRTQYYAATEEMHDEAAFAAIPADQQVSARGIEVGHIFNFGTKYSLPMNAVVQSADGQMVPVQMGSYGIGVSRLVGGIIEACHDENGIVWPESVAPWHVGLINMRVGDAACDAACADADKALSDAGMDVLYDDTDERAGGKFARMELIGLPWQIVIGPRGIENGVVEVKNRKSGEKAQMPFAEALKKVAPK
jgi:prolyl-tRNA synthetase